MRKTLIGLAICLATILCFATVVNASTVNFYDEDGGNQIGTMQNVFNTLTNITVADPTKDGNEFGGWASNDANVTLSEDGTQVAGPYNPFDFRNRFSFLNVYATWDLIDYEITYELNGGEVEGNPDTYTIEDEDITLNNPTREGYEFVGWTDEEGEDLGTEVVIPAGSTGDLTFIAEWEPIVYTIDYVLDGGEVEGNPDTYTIEDSFTLNNPTKEGFNFVGWEDEEGNDLGTTATIEEGTTGDKVFTAKWEAIPEVEEPEEEEEATSNPKTGDNIAVYVAILALATAGVIAIKKFMK